MSDARIGQEARVPATQAIEARLSAFEVEQQRQGDLIEDVHAAVLGKADGSQLGYGELIRELQRQVKVLQWVVFVLVGGAIGTAGTAVFSAWAIKWLGPQPAQPTVIYVQASPPTAHGHR